jgi:catechol 2,3-dioxygenase-like lactoylglutathione lyase family enzyme
MPQSLARVALIVRDYDEAIAWFTEMLGFTLVADEVQPEQDKRWVLVALPFAGDDAATLLLARGATPEQAAFIGNQAGGRFGARHHPVMAALPHSCSTSGPLDGSRQQRRPTISGATITPSPPKTSASSALPPSGPTEL